MTEHKPKPVYLWVASAAVLAGTILCFYTAIVTPDAIEKMGRKSQVLQELRGIETLAAAEKAAIAQFENLPPARIFPLKELIGQVAGNVQVDIRQRETRALAEDWVLHRSEVVFSDISLKAVGRLMQSAENSRPPWRVVECQISVSQRAEPSGRVILILEALEKNREGDS